MKYIWYLVLVWVPVSGMAKRSYFMNVCKKLVAGKMLVEEIPLDQFQWIDCEGKTILHYATYYDNNGSIILALCDACPSLIEKTDKAFYTPLHSAAFHGNLYAVEALLEKKANPYKKTQSGKSPIHLVMFLNYFPAIKSIVNRLFHAGTPLDERDAYNNTPLHTLAYQGNEELYNYVRKDIPFEPTLKNSANYTPEEILITAQVPELAAQYITRFIKSTQLKRDKSQQTQDQRNNSKTRSNLSLRPS